MVSLFDRRKPTVAGPFRTWHPVPFSTHRFDTQSPLTIRCPRTLRRIQCLGMRVIGARTARRGNFMRPRFRWDALTFLLLLPAAAAAGEPAGVMVKPIRPLDALSGEQAVLVTSFVAQSLGEYPQYRVVGPNELDRILSPVQKAELSVCANTACVSKYAAMTGASLVVGGTAGRTAVGPQITLVLIDARRSSIVGNRTGPADGNNAQLHATTKALLKQLLTPAIAEPAPIAIPVVAPVPIVPAYSAPLPVQTYTPPPAQPAPAAPMPISQPGLQPPPQFQPVYTPPPQLAQPMPMAQPASQPPPQYQPVYAPPPQPAQPMPPTRPTPQPPPQYQPVYASPPQPAQPMSMTQPAPQPLPPGPQAYMPPQQPPSKNTLPSAPAPQQSQYVPMAYNNQPGPLAVGQPAGNAIVAKPVAPADKGMSRYKLWGHVSFWSGLALAGFGGVSMFMAKQAADDYNSGVNVADADSRNATWSGLSLTGFIVGGVLMATGGTLWYLDSTTLNSGK